MFANRAKIWPLPDHEQPTTMVAGYRCGRGEEKAGTPSDEWLATLSHELRSPLATIFYALEVISGTDLDPAASRACDVAERQARKITQLVEELLDASASSLGQLRICKEPVDLATIVSRAAETVGLLLAKRGRRLTVSLPPEPVTLYADPLRLEQVLTNLLANAAKFTDPGGHIRLTATEEAGHVEVRVRDDGRGIAPELLPRVFHLFQRGLHSGEQASDGLGIGLALVKSLVGLHGGSVTASSDGPGTGAEFVVRLPACR
jgi:signal transduction histidine kinase